MFEKTLHFLNLIVNPKPDIHIPPSETKRYPYHSCVFPISEFGAPSFTSRVSRNMPQTSRCRTSDAHSTDFVVHQDLCSGPLEKGYLHSGSLLNHSREPSMSSEMQSPSSSLHSAHLVSPRGGAEEMPWVLDKIDGASAIRQLCKPEPLIEAVILYPPVSAEAPRSEQHVNHTLCGRECQVQKGRLTCGSSNPQVLESVVQNESGYFNPIFPARHLRRIKRNISSNFPKLYRPALASISIQKSAERRHSPQCFKISSPDFAVPLSDGAFPRASFGLSPVIEDPSASRISSSTCSTCSLELSLEHSKMAEVERTGEPHSEGREETRDQATFLEWNPGNNMSCIFPLFDSFNDSNGANRMNPAVPTVPCLTVTSPTPEIPKSPVFAPHSPLTASKYIAASKSALENFAGLTARSNSRIGNICSSPAPTLPECSRCGADGMFEDFQCLACERQWLACKLWYHSSDGGRSRCLREPYTIPGESNASSRAMTGYLGLPVGSSRGLGIDMGADGLILQDSRLNSKRGTVDISGDALSSDQEKFDERGRIRGRPEEQELLASSTQVPKRRRVAVAVRNLGTGTKSAWRTITKLFRNSL